MSARDPNYPAAFFARLFNLTERRIQQLAKDGIIPKAAQGKYPLIGVVQAYVKFLQERSLTGEVSERDKDIKGLRSRLIEAQAIAIELKNEVARGETAPIEVIGDVLSKVCAVIAAEVDSIPLQIKRKHPSLDTAVIESIKRHCVKAMNAIARSDEYLDAILDEISADSATASDIPQDSSARDALLL